MIPRTQALVNNGQARITNEADDDKVLKELRGELSTFVCEGQYADGIHKILSSFLANRSQTSQKAAWVSGFFGSGKSHLLKMLCHLWQDTEFPDGATARSLVPELPEDVRSLLRELDTAGKRSGGLLAAAGTLPAGTTENVRLSVLEHPPPRRRASRPVSPGAVPSLARRAQVPRPGEIGMWKLPARNGRAN